MDIYQPPIDISREASTPMHTGRRAPICCAAPIVIVAIALLAGWGLTAYVASAASRSPGNIVYRGDRDVTGGHPAGDALAASGAYSVLLPSIANAYDPVPKLFGIQMYSGINAASGLTRVAEARAHWLRFQVAWDRIEPANTLPISYAWAGLDVAIQNASDLNLRIVATIESNPAWAAERINGPVTSTADLLEFVGAVVARYPQITYWELYNEPDRTDIGYGFNGAAYGAMLNAVYPVVKAANPAAQLVMGGLALDWFHDSGGLFDRQFLTDTLAGCAGEACFDVANFHYYPIFRSGWEAYGRDIIGKASFVRGVLRAHGYDRPLINTETGWPTGEHSGWGNVDLAARYVVKQYARSMAAGLSMAIWYALTDADTTAPGLLGPGLEPRPSYTAYQVLTEQLGRADFVRAIPSNETGSSRVEGYQFIAPASGGRTRLDVYWYDCQTLVYYWPYPYDCTESAPLTISASRIAVTSYLGVTNVVNDADDRVVDGRVTIPGGVNTNPIYVDYSP